jgi:hypothetical protein
MSSTIASTQPETGSKLSLDLVLARILVASKRPPTVNAVRKDLGKVLGHEPSTETLQDWVDQLRAEGLISEKLTLTEAGRRRALGFLGTEAVPARTTWASLVPKYFVPRALGVDLSDGSSVKRLAREEGLAGAMLKRQFGITVTAKESLDSVLEAFVCKKLGYDVASLKDLKQQVIGEVLEANDAGIPKKPMAQARALLKANNLSQLRSKALAEWALAEHEQPRTALETQNVDSFDLDEFSRTVLAAARHCPSGWFGDNKVFINHLYRHLQSEPAFHGMRLEDFKQRLVQANQGDRLELSRADLVSVMDPSDVRESETFQLGAAYHFLFFVEKDRP